MRLGGFLLGLVVHLLAFDTNFYDTLARRYYVVRVMTEKENNRIDDIDAPADIV